MSNDNRLETLRKKLRLKLRDAGGDVAVASPELTLLLDEVGRLQQSNDRLRRQNRRMRLRCQKLGVDVTDIAADASGPDDGQA
ncbi:MAG: hypothetical protein KDC98_19310 [Planctomycetes bacterium]|nr:hypothetical protein [Planctomycetota bacterium]